MQFFSKICNFSQKYAIFSQKICIGKCLKFSYTYKKNAITFTAKYECACLPKYLATTYLDIIDNWQFSLTLSFIGLCMYVVSCMLFFISDFLLESKVSIFYS